MMVCAVVWTGPAAVTACTPCVHGFVRLRHNSIGAEGCAALAGALVHVPSLTTLQYVGCGVMCGGCVVYELRA